MDLSRLAEIAPKWAAMKAAIEKCYGFDEVETIAKTDPALAVRAYYTIARDIDNEIGAAKARIRAGRGLQQLLRARPARISALTGEKLP